MRVDIERLARLLRTALQVEVTREDLDTAQIVSRNREKYIEVLSLHAICIPTDYGGIVYSRPTRVLSVVGRGAVADISDVDESALDRVLWLLSRHAETGDPRYLVHALIELGLSPKDVETAVSVTGLSHPDVTQALRRGVRPSEVVAERVLSHQELRRAYTVSAEKAIEVAKKLVEREGPYAIDVGVLDIVRERLSSMSRFKILAEEVGESVSEVKTKLAERTLLVGHLIILEEPKLEEVFDTYSDLKDANVETWDDFRRRLKYDKIGGYYYVPRTSIRVDRDTMKTLMRIVERVGKPEKVLVGENHLLLLFGRETAVLI